MDSFKYDEKPINELKVEYGLEDKKDPQNEVPNPVLNKDLNQHLSKDQEKEQAKEQNEEKKSEPEVFHTIRQRSDMTTSLTGIFKQRGKEYALGSQIDIRQISENSIAKMKTKTKFSGLLKQTYTVPVYESAKNYVSVKKQNLEKIQNGINRVADTKAEYRMNVRYDLKTACGYENVRTMSQFVPFLLEKGYKNDHIDNMLKDYTKKDDTSFFETMTREFMKIDVSDYPLDSDEVIAENAAKYESFSSFVIAYKKLIGKYPEDTVNRVITDGNQANTSRLEVFKRQMRLLTSMNDYYRVRKMIMEDPIYANKSGELRLTYTDKDTFATERLKKLIRISFHMAENLNKIAGKNRIRTPELDDGSDERSLKINRRLKNIFETKYVSGDRFDEKEAVIETELQKLEHERFYVPEEGMEKMLSGKGKKFSILKALGYMNSDMKAGNQLEETVAEKKRPELLRKIQEYRSMFKKGVFPSRPFGLKEAKKYPELRDLVVDDMLDRSYTRMVSELSYKRSDMEVLEMICDLTLNRTPIYEEQETFTEEERAYIEESYAHAVMENFASHDAQIKRIGNSVGGKLVTMHPVDLMRSLTDEGAGIMLGQVAMTNICAESNQPKLKSFIKTYNADGTYDIDADTFAEAGDAYASINYMDVINVNGGLVPDSEVITNWYQKNKNNAQVKELKKKYKDNPVGQRTIYMALNQNPYSEENLIRKTDCTGEATGMLRTIKVTKQKEQVKKLADAGMLKLPSVAELDAEERNLTKREMNALTTDANDLYDLSFYKNLSVKKTEKKTEKKTPKKVEEKKAEPKVEVKVEEKKAEPKVDNLYRFSEDENLFEMEDRKSDLKAFNFNSIYEDPVFTDGFGYSLSPEEESTRIDYDVKDEYAAGYLKKDPKSRLYNQWESEKGKKNFYSRKVFESDDSAKEYGMDEGHITLVEQLMTDAKTYDAKGNTIYHETPAMKVYLSSDVNEIKSFMNDEEHKQARDLAYGIYPKLKDYLKDRIAFLTKAEKQKGKEKPKEFGKVIMNGKTLSEADQKKLANSKNLYDKNNCYEVSGVKNGGLQTTSVGCWSVSLSSQMKSRGYDFSQKEIRLFRPKNIDPEGLATDLEFVGRDNMGSPFEFAELMNQVQKNTATHVIEIRMEAEHGNELQADKKKLGGNVSNTDVIESNAKYQRYNEQYIEYIRRSIVDAIVKHKSPVSLLRGGHFITIDAIEGTKVRYYDSKSKRKDGLRFGDLKDLYSTFQMQLVWFEQLPADDKELKKALSGQTSEASYKNGKIQKKVREGNQEIRQFNAAAQGYTLDVEKQKKMDDMRKEGSSIYPGAAILEEKEEIMVRDVVFLPDEIQKA